MPMRTILRLLPVLLMLLILAALVLYGQNEGEDPEYPRPAGHIYEHKHKEEGTWRFLTESCWPG